MTTRPGYDRLRHEVEKGLYPFRPQDEAVLFARAVALERVAEAAREYVAQVDTLTFERLANALTSLDAEAAT
ncbi:MAG TPA: hypothetical protein VN085_11520 [Vicinamibacterales bacterium]|nr:hypothetical protein [Vicinamibacterales bacterium]